VAATAFSTAKCLGLSLSSSWCKAKGSLSVAATISSIKLSEAFKRDVPKAMVEFIDAGHFPLETHLHEIANRIRTFLGGL
jgi:hypothetical protein